MTLDEFYEMPVIMSFFPLTFSSGRQKWTNFNIDCNDCKRPISEDLTRGYVEKTLVGGYRDVASTSYVVTAHGLCLLCNVLTDCTYTLHENMTLTGFHPKTGEMSMWGMRKLTFIEKLKEKWSAYWS